MKITIYSWSISCALRQRAAAECPVSPQATPGYLMHAATAARSCWTRLVDGRQSEGATAIPGKICGVENATTLVVSVPGRPLPWKKVLTMALLKTASYAIARRTKMTALAGFYKY
ncbi:hypothetical protein [Streptomyces sp. NPDC014995]|uniref:hypothetical protein n=1 Tax=Streptomyces sp. NPDC014995 TaxID=3364936 RepID=UPI0036F7E142